MSKIEIASLDLYAKRAYLAYAMQVVRGRAIPSVEDGLKPVQRRVLYAMKKLRLTPTAEAMKCARVVGDVLGQFHPHGDSATYEAMVRMAQPFSLRYPLVNGQGNFGSRDGDTAAAYRYTEAKLMPITMTLLDELQWETVDFKPNFDGKEVEPVTLPSRLPFLLLNGASGIGVGLATEFPSHNLREVVEAAKLLVKNPKTTAQELFQHIQGPDYPCGGVLISSPEEIFKIYEEGRGSLRLRANWKVEQGEKGKWWLVFDELPQTTNAEAVLLQIAALLDPKPKEKNGKKLPLTPDQLRIKKLFSELIENFENHSDRNEQMRLVIFPKDKKIKPDDLALALCAHTQLEDSIPVNLVAVDNKGNPRKGSLWDWLGQWTEYRVATVRRRTEHQKKQVDHRLHIIAGRLLVLDHIQEVVKLLTSSDEPKKDLMEKFGLDEEQAEDILELRLRSIARLEKKSLLDEKAKLDPEQARLGKLLEDDKALRKMVIQELDNDAKLFGDERRTALKPSSATSTKKMAQETSVSEKLAPEPIAIALTERGWLAWRPAKSWEEAQSLDYKIKTGDQIKRVFFGDRSDYLALLDEQGRVYSLRLTELASKADTVPCSTWFDHAGKIVEGMLTNPDATYLIAGENGYGFIAKASQWINRMKAGKAFLTLDEGEKPLPPLPVSLEDKERDLIVLSSDGRAVVFPVRDVKELPRGKGVALIGLAKGCKVSDMAVVGEEPLRLLTPKGSEHPVAKDVLAELKGTRSSSKKGKPLHKQSSDAILVRPGRERWKPIAE